MPSTTFVACLALLALALRGEGQAPQTALQGEEAAGAPEKTGQKETSPAVPQPEAKLSEKDALCLAEACRLTALINDGKWDEVEKALGTEEGMVAILKRDAATENWPGIGAYRGFRIDRESPRQVTFRFGFAPRSNPHELQISFTGGDPSKPALMVLGW